jgi:hypothetical protein
MIILIGIIYNLCKRGEKYENRNAKDAEECEWELLRDATKIVGGRSGVKKR